MKTRIYVDGYNLYYGCLKKTPYKWLDLVGLFQNHLLPRSGERTSLLHSNEGVRFYTAEISDKASADVRSVDDQRSYHAALTAYRPHTVKIIKGNYAIDKVDNRKYELTSEGKEKQPRECPYVKVWKFEEKQSDVNIAVDAVFDAMTDETLDQVVFVTNDTDIAPALAKIRVLNSLGRRSPVKIGLIVPAKEKNGPRRTNRTLSDLADWTIDFIKNEELAISQLPCRVSEQNQKKAALRPVSWFEYTEEVSELLNILCQQYVCGSLPRAWRWLSEPKPYVDGLPVLADDPSTMLHELDGIRAVLLHAQAYADYRKLHQEPKE